MYLYHHDRCVTTYIEPKRVRIIGLKGTEQILCAMLCPPVVQSCGWEAANLASLLSPSDNAEPHKMELAEFIPGSLNHQQPGIHTLDC